LIAGKVKTGERVKTDRLDAAKLAEYYAKDLLTPIYIPDETDEEVRDILRSRNFLVKQRKMLKTHILSACKRYDIRFQDETGRKTNWTDQHIAWLRTRAKSMSRPVCQIDIEMLLAQYTSLSENIEKLEAAISQVAESERYKKPKDVLNTFRGIDTLSAMTIISEIGDIRRFVHPRQLTSYAGLDIVFNDSGLKKGKTSISKKGNTYIRKALFMPALSACRANPQMKELYKRLVAKGKNKKLAIIAVARKLLLLIYTLWKSNSSYIPDYKPLLCAVESLSS